MLYEILWPCHRWVDSKKLISWATDDVYNGNTDLPLPNNVEEAIEILNDTGSITVGKGRKYAN